MSSKPMSNNSIIYGRNPIIDAINEDKKFERIYVRDQLTGEFEKWIRGACKEKDIPLRKVPQVKLDRMSRHRNHQGVVGVGSIVTYLEINHAIPHLYEQGIDPVIVLLDNVQDVRNIGAIARSVEALGGHLLVISGRNAGMITHDSIKASAGALSRLMVCRTKNTIDTLAELSSHGITTIGSSLSASTDLSETSLPTSTCVVLGSEGVGLHRSVEEKCDMLIKIPQIGDSESLNVSVAAGIILYELNRSKQ